MKLGEAFYSRKDVVTVAKELLGKVLVTNFEGIYTSGMIVETEAYAGAADKASHAYGNRRTNRTEIMYSKGGTAYVYLCYGIHHLFNVVTNVQDVPHAVLIRGVEPLEGIAHMLERRRKENLQPSLTAGPGALSSGFGHPYQAYGSVAAGWDEVWIEDRGIKLKKDQVISRYKGRRGLCPGRCIPALQVLDKGQ